MGCPGFEDLIDFMDGALTEARATVVREHLASGCGHCDADISWYKRVRNVASLDDSLEPPAWVLKRALRIIDDGHKRRPTERYRGPGIASLIFDSLARPLPAGVRSTATDQRQLLYRAGGYSIDVQVILAEGDLADLLGQVLFEGEAGFESVKGIGLELGLGGVPVASAVTDSIGEFSIRGVVPGEYELDIESEDGKIIVPCLPMRLLG
jgi:hypothetical protein